MDLYSNNGHLLPPLRKRLVVKIALLLSTLIFITIITVGLIHYQNSADLILRSLQHQVLLAANAMSLAIDGDLYAALKGNYSIEGPEYQHIRKKLDEFYYQNRSLGFSEDGIYTLTRVSADSAKFTVMLHDAHVGNLYSLRPEMKAVFENGVSAYTGTYRDDFGTWVSGYAPIRTSQGKVVGLVEVDLRESVYTEALNSALLSLALHSLIGGIIAILIAIVVTRSVTHPIVEISQAARAVANGDLSKTVTVKTDDEIGTLGVVFNSLVKGFREKEIFKKKSEELAQAYEELETMNRSYHEASRLKSEFLSIAAHDLKNPLAAILGYAELILKTGEPDERTQRYADIIAKNADRMVMLVTDLLLTEQLTSGKIRLEKEVTDVGALARSVVEANQLMAKRKSQRLTITTGGHCLATIDENRIYQSMENLVSNAIKYCGEGKSIHVEVQHHGHSIRFSVQDHGPGFTDIERQKLFRRFVRLSARPTGGEHSTGLGLSVVKRLVELHGGTVGAISEGTNKGSTFFFDIPAERIAVLAP